MVTNLPSLWNKGLYVLFLVLALPCTAGTMGIAEKSWHPIIALGAGTSTVGQLGRSQSFPIINPLTDEFYHYSAIHKNQTSGLWDVVLGIEWILSPVWKLQTAIDYNQAAPFTATGIFLQGADAQSADSYSYRYRAITRQLLINGKLLYTIQERFHPYALLGLGANFNKAYQYTTSVPPFLTFTRLYANHNQASFGYALGLGLDVDITERLRAGIGYRYAGLGKLQLGQALIDTTPVLGTLTQNNLHSNEVLLQLTWIFK